MWLKFLKLCVGSGSWLQTQETHGAVLKESWLPSNCAHQRSFLLSKVQGDIMLLSQLVIFLKQAYMSSISRISHIILFIYFFTFTAFSKNVLEVVTRCASNFTVFQFHNKTSLSCRLQKTFSSPLNSDSKTLLNLTNEYWVVNVGYCAVQNSAYYFHLLHWINYWTLTVIASSYRCVFDCLADNTVQRMCTITYMLCYIPLRDTE